jgi:hypothetical protein
MKKLKKIEKFSILLTIFNAGVFIFNTIYSTENTITAVFNIFTIYFLIYLILGLCMDSFAKQLLEKTVEYFKLNYSTTGFTFNRSFYNSLSRLYITYIFISFLFIDLYSIIKYKFPILSFVGYFIPNYNDEMMSPV